MSATSRKSEEIKILLVGDKDTGKHCFARRLIENRYPRDRWSNNDCDTCEFRIRLDQDVEIPVKIFVVRGASRGKTALKKIYKDIHGYIVMFDVTNPESYDNIVGWKKDIDVIHSSNKIPPCIVVANKTDLEKDKDLEKQLTEIEGYCEALGFSGHFEISCQNGTGVRESFTRLIREIQNHSTSVEVSQPSIPSTENQNGNDGLSPSRHLTQEHIFKIVVIGDIATGKTAIIQRYVRKSHSANYLPTIGVDIAQKKLQYGTDTINVHIWEVAGTERVGSVTHLFYRGAAGCLVVFDQSKISTLNGAAKWKTDFDEKVNWDENNQIPCVLVGNKSDLPKDGAIKDDTYMTDFMTGHKFLRWFQTSAKDNININETFTYLINEIVGKLAQTTGSPRTIHNLQTLNSSTRNSDKSVCCSK